MAADRPGYVGVCGFYLGDNDATTPQLTCLRNRGHAGLHDNVCGDEPATPALPPYEPPTLTFVGSLRDVKAASAACGGGPHLPPWCP